MLVQLIKYYLFYFSVTQGAASLLSASPPTVNTSQGLLTGLHLKTINNRDYAAFVGIPYAKPPIGPLRFKVSEPLTKWIGVYNATTYSDCCLQYSHVTYPTITPVIGSEDCLYLNVYVPLLADNEKVSSDGMDVLVFIHGGAFMYFAGTYYRPDYLLDRNVILVTLNYRLGPLGFLSTEDEILPGNNGLKDQSLALKWVHDNINSFGGNPKSITISGLSAGGASVHFHVLSPMSQGYFTKAISDGGSALCPWTIVENSREKAIKLANYLGCPTNNSQIIVDCLRERPASRIVGATSLFMPWMYNPYSPFGIVIESPSPSAFLTEQPIDIILKKKAKDMPYLTTINADEGLYPGAEIFAHPKQIEAIDEKWNEYLPFLLDYNNTIPEEEIEEVNKKIWKFYLGDGHVNDEKEKFIKMLGDRLFYVGVVKTTKLHAEHYSSPVYSYLFSHKGSRRLSDIFHMKTETYNGTGHGDDVGYVLKATYMPIDDSPEDMKLSKRMIDYWVTFIKGEPMPKGWPTVKENLPNYAFLEIQNVDSNNDIVRIEKDYANEKFWDSINFKENIPVK